MCFLASLVILTMTLVCCFLFRGCKVSRLDERKSATRGSARAASGEGQGVVGQTVRGTSGGRADMGRARPFRLFILHWAEHQYPHGDVSPPYGAFSGGPLWNTGSYFTVTLGRVCRGATEAGTNIVTPLLTLV